MSEMEQEIVLGNFPPELALETPEADAIDQSQLVGDDDDDEAYR